MEVDEYAIDCLILGRPVFLKERDQLFYEKAEELGLSPLVSSRDLPMFKLKKGRPYISVDSDSQPVESILSKLPNIKVEIYDDRNLGQNRVILSPA